MSVIRKILGFLIELARAYVSVVGIVLVFLFGVYRKVMGWLGGFVRVHKKAIVLGAILICSGLYGLDKSLESRQFFRESLSARRNYLKKYWRAKYRYATEREAELYKTELKLYKKAEDALLPCNVEKKQTFFISPEINIGVCDGHIIPSVKMTYFDNANAVSRIEYEWVGADGGLGTAVLAVRSELPIYNKLTWGLVDLCFPLLADSDTAGAGDIPADKFCRIRSDGLLRMLEKKGKLILKGNSDEIIDEIELSDFICVDRKKLEEKYNYEMSAKLAVLINRLDAYAIEVCNGQTAIVEYEGGYLRIKVNKTGIENGGYIIEFSEDRDFEDGCEEIASYSGMFWQQDVRVESQVIRFVGGTEKSVFITVPFLKAGVTIYIDE